MHLETGVNTPLTQEQRALGGCHGDIVAAVLLYLRWIANKLSSAELRLLKQQCFRKMQSGLVRKGWDLDGPCLLELDDRKPTLLLCLSFAYQSIIFHNNGDNEHFQAALAETDGPPSGIGRSYGLEPQRLRIRVSPRSLCGNMSPAPKWIV